MKILIADTDEISCEMLRAMLENWGHEVADFSNGSDVLEQLKTGNFSMAIIENVLPDINGMEIVETLRSLPEASYVYIIILTEMESQFNVNQGLKKGADDYIKKPYDVIELFSRVNAGVRILELQGSLQNKIGELNSVNSKLVEAYQNIKNMKDKLNSKLEISNRPTFVLDKKLTVEMVNIPGKDLLNLMRNEILGKSFLEFIRDDDQWEFQKSVGVAKMSAGKMNQLGLIVDNEIKIQTADVLRIDSQRQYRYLVVMAEPGD